MVESRVMGAAFDHEGRNRGWLASTSVDQEAEFARTGARLEPLNPSPQQCRQQGQLIYQT